MARDPRTEKLLERFDTLRSQRANWETHWQEIADYMIPRKNDVIHQTPTAGEKKMDLVYDSTAIHALELLASSLHGMLSSSASPWVTLQFADRQLNDDVVAMEWLENATQVIYEFLSKSNFDQEIHELYYDLCAFGTACLLIEDDGVNGVRFSARHIAELYLAENSSGRVDVVYRKFKMSGKAMIERFGQQALPTQLLKQINKDPFIDHELLHVVQPRDQRDPTKVDALNKPFESVYIEQQSRKIIADEGFDSFPYCPVRMLKDSASVYGRSSAMVALPDVKMLQKMSETTIKAAQKMVDPPLLVPDDGFAMPVRTTPGGLNFYRPGSRDKIEPLNIGANTPVGIQMEEQRRNAIRQAFFVDQLIMPTGPQMTATETVARTEQKMRLLGPVMGRVSQDLLKPAINRVFDILQRQGRFGEIPEQLDAQETKVEYVSPLAKAQRTGDLQSLMRGVEILGSLAQVAPVFDYLDSDALVKHLFDILGIPAKITRSAEEVAMMRDEQAEQLAQQQEMQATMEMAQAAGAAAPALKVVNDMGPAAAPAE